MREQMLRGKAGRFLADYLVLIAILLISVYTMIVEPSFLSIANLTNIARQMCTTGVCAIGLTIAIVGGFTDLSVAGMVSMLAVIFGTISHLDPWLVIVLGLAFGAATGLLNGCIMVGFGARNLTDMLFISFGMSQVYNAIATLISANYLSLPDEPVFAALGAGSVLGIPVSFLVFLAFIIVGHVFLKYSVAGKSIYCIGGNPEAARLSGINVKKLTIIMFTIVGFMAALAALLAFCRTTVAYSRSGLNYDVNCITAVVLGGTALGGGRGGIINTLLGTLMVTLVSNSLNLLGFNSNVQLAVEGAILIAVVLLDTRRESLGVKA